ncbi:MAG: branched-chain amino acid ABC transporter permease [Hyphomicrobiaceae bacterium]|nr:branched-chain amino acid ABC transporter permease [Hyphomicrobiaceae bacterium]
MITEPWYWTQQAVNALVVSSFYCLFATAFVLVLGVTNRINLAFGAIATWAGYSAIATADVLLTTTFLSHGAILALVAVAVAGMGIGFGLLFGRGLLGRLVGEPVAAMFVATLGLALALEEAIRVVAASRDMWLEPLWSEPLLILPFGARDVRISAVQALVTVAGFATSVAVWAALARTRYGRAWRAVSQDPGMARLLGIDPVRVVAVACVLSCLASAQAGAGFAAYYGNIAPYNGFTMGLKALFISIVGGTRSMRGALVGGIGIGLFETLWSAAMPMALRDAATFAVLIAALVLFAPGKADIDTRERG